MGEYGLENHEKFGFYINGRMKLLIDEVMKSKNYNFTTFSELIPEFAEDLANVPDFLYGFPPRTEKSIIVNKIKGDIFELFTMFFLQHFECYPKIGVKKGTYSQISDEFDTGIDFKGEFAAKSGSRVFGQIKFRNPDHAPEGDAIPFTTKVVQNLIGAAYIDDDFDKTKDHIMLVTNIHLNDAMYYKLRDRLGMSGSSIAPKFRYIKIIDETVFNDLIDYDSENFWKEFSSLF